MKKLSPIEIMIDQATGYEEEDFTVEEKSEIIRNEIISHIDVMYPDMWKGVPKTARSSLKNLIVQQIVLFFGRSRL